MSAHTNDRHSPYGRGRSALPLLLGAYGYEICAPYLQLVGGSESLTIAFRLLILLIITNLIVTMRGQFSRRTILIMPFICFCMIYLARLFENGYLRGLVWSDDPLRATAMLLLVGLFPGVVLASHCRRLDPENLFRTSVLLAGVFIVGLGLNYETLSSNAQAGQAALSKLNPISLSAIAASFVVTLAILPATSRVMLALKIVLLAMLLSVMAYAQARGPIVSLGVGLLVVLALANRRSRINLALATVALVAMLAATSVFGGLDLFDLGLKRFFLRPDQFDSLQHDSAALRLIAWNEAWQAFLANPLFGDTVFSRFLGRYPHNYLLESLMSVGLAGSIFLLLHLATCACAIGRIAKSRSPDLVGVVLAALTVKEFAALQFSSAVWGGTAFAVLSACLIVRSTIFHSAQVANSRRIDAHA